MKLVINGRSYDTDTATLVGEMWSILNARSVLPLPLTF